MANEKDDRVRITKTLESKLIQNAVGSNLVKTNPYLYAGQLGFQSAESVYANVLSGDDAKKEKDEIYGFRKSEGEQLDVFGEPAYPSDYDLSVKLARQLEEVLQIATLSELEKAAKAVGAKLSFEVPKELQDYFASDLMQKAIDKKTGKVDIKLLNEQEQHAFAFYQTLSESYKRACAFKATQTNYFADLDKQGKTIADFYKPKEELAEAA